MRVACDASGIKKASHVIATSGVVIFPTDTVYGIGCNPYDIDAVNKIYSIKSRDRSKPLPVLVPSTKVAESIAIFGDKSKMLASRFWPGSLTLLLYTNDKKLSDSLNLKDGKIALRVPKHVCTLMLLEESGPLVGTSANVSMHPSTNNPDECANTMNGYDILLDGGIIGEKTGVTTESTIIDMTDDGNIRMMREGSIKMAEVYHTL